LGDKGRVGKGASVSSAQTADAGGEEGEEGGGLRVFYS
jgi:hypothetical protein